jgi:hypothetical protein
VLEVEQPIFLTKASESPFPDASTFCQVRIKRCAGVSWTLQLQGLCHGTESYYQNTDARKRIYKSTVNAAQRNAEDELST